MKTKSGTKPKKVWKFFHSAAPLLDWDDVFGNPDGFDRELELLELGRLLLLLLLLLLPLVGVLVGVLVVRELVTVGGRFVDVEVEVKVKVSVEPPRLH